MTYETIILAAAKAAKISGTVLLAICTHETGLKNVTVQYDGGSPSIGICQVKLETAKMLGYNGNQKGLEDVEVNAKWAGAYLKYQYNRYGHNWCQAVAAYNAGKYNESKSARGCPRNLKYVRHVQEKVAVYMKPQLSCNRAENP